MIKTSCTPSKDFKKLDHRNAINRENIGPTPTFSHFPKYTPQNNLKMTVHLCKWIFLQFSGTCLNVPPLVPPNLTALHSALTRMKICASWEPKIS
jgi:hypothetical protein